MLLHSTAHASVYQVLDKVLADGVAAPGARGAVSSVIDELRLSDPTDASLSRAEAVSIQLHQLEWARLHGNEKAAADALTKLRELAVKWLDARIRN